MSDLSGQASADRYDVSGNAEAQYIDAAQQILKNKRGITELRALQVEEEKALAVAYERLLAEVLADTPITTDLIRHAHDAIFGGLYEWAGRWRTVRISKPGVSWPPPDFLGQAMRAFERDVLRPYPARKLAGDEAFCRAVGHIQGEFLAIHPFREGNARTIKLATDLLAVQTGRLPLRYDMTEDGRDGYIAAARAALAKDYGPMADVIRAALTASR